MNAVARDLTKNCEEVSQLLAALAHPVRLKILCRLMDGEATVSELTEFCEISQSAMSQFLSRMKDEGVLACRRESTRQLYSVKEKRVFELLKAIKIICGRGK